MCGIGAIFDPAGEASMEPGNLMVAALRHRGPDGEAVRRIGPVVLAFTRLAIIDVEGGEQPLTSEDGSCSVVVNGEIYNQLSLRSELERLGHRFATRSDCEVVVHAYEQWGMECVGRLNGIFAFALWDDREQRLVVARDPYGVKPLYWCDDGRRVAVASEVGALLAAGLLEPAVDRIGLDHFLALGFSPAPRTLFEGVRKLPPAATLTADRSGVAVASYREPPGEPLEQPADDLEAEFLDRFLDAVERQMMSDVPLGAFLSGGVDSAAVVAAMCKRSDQPPATFTIGFPEFAGQGVDERNSAEEIAAALGTRHHTAAMVGEDFLLPRLGSYVRRLEEPSGRTSSPALWRLSRCAARSVKVVLSGQGADEAHGGYVHHRVAALLSATRRIPGSLGRPVRAFGSAVPGRGRIKRVGRLIEAGSDVEWLLRLVETTDSALRSQLTGRTVADEAEAERQDIARGVLAGVNDRDLLEQALYLDTHMLLPDRLLNIADKMSMAAGVEQRIPYLDVELMRFVERIPATVRVRGGTAKRLLRGAVKPLLPASVATRRKQPFSTPYTHGFRNALGDEIARRFQRDSRLGGLIDPAVVARLVESHRSGRADHTGTLVCLFELSEWHRTFID